MICFPNAKINLGLSVTEKRPDGMHNIETCYVPIPLCDVLEFRPSNSFSLRLFGLPLQGKPEENLVAKTWTLVSSIKKDMLPVEVCLQKAIPPGSGLGGGSSDAAFFLKALNNYFSLGFSVPDMESIIGEIGADCPFFINNRSAIATCTGNILSPVHNPIFGLFVTVVCPNINISTKTAFSKINPVKNPDLRQIVVGDITDWKNKLGNDFEETIFRDYPELKNIKSLLYKSGAVYASLTGSGSALYALSLKPMDTKWLSDRYMVWTFSNQNIINI